MGVVVFVGVAGLVLVLSLGMVLMRVGVQVVFFVFVGVCMGLLGEGCAFVDVNRGGGDAAAVDLIDFEGRVEVEGGYGFVEDVWVDSGVEEGSEKHVATDAGEAVEIGDAHGGYCFMVAWRSLLRQSILLDESLKRSRIPAVPLPLISGAIERYLRCSTP